jgi:hypothetical protein
VYSAARSSGCAVVSTLLSSLTIKLFLLSSFTFSDISYGAGELRSRIRVSDLVVYDRMNAAAALRVLHLPTLKTLHARAVRCTDARARARCKVLLFLQILSRGLVDAYVLQCGGSLSSGNLLPYACCSLFLLVSFCPFTQRCPLFFLFSLSCRYLEPDTPLLSRVRHATRLAYAAVSFV